MPVITNAGVGGGAGSDECTLVKANVPLGLRAVTADSDDEAAEGTLNAESSAADTHVLEGQTYFKFNFTSGRWEKRNGKRKNNGTLSAALNCGESFTIPAGDTVGGKVTANSLASQTPGTATAADIMAGKTATVNGVKIVGVKVNYGTINATLQCGQSKTLPAGSIDGGTITAASLASQTPGNLAANKMLAGTYGVSKGVRVDGNIASVGGPSIAPQTYAQAISVGGKYVTGNGNVAGVALPPAAALKKGYRYWIGNNYVDGNFQGYVDSPLYLYNKGVWSNLQTTGLTLVTHKPEDRIIIRYEASMVALKNRLGGGIDLSYYHASVRLNQTVPLTNYNYLKVFVNKGALGNVRVGISTSPTATSYVAYTEVSGDGYAILNVANITGNYYIYIEYLPGSGYIASASAESRLFGGFSEILLSAA